MRALFLLAIVLPLPAAVVLDRVAVVVDSTRVVKDSDIEREIRVVDYLNGDPLAFTPKARREAAGRLIDQAVIRREMELGRYPEAEDKEVDRLFAETLKSRPAPETYGLRPEQVRRALKWQLTVLGFIDLRFRPRPQHASDADPFVAWLDAARKGTKVDYREEALK